jgi:DNA invertase Pin-like site-specific DNA recombinase
MSRVEIINAVPRIVDDVKRVCAYVRVSTKDSHQDSSYNIQVESYTNMILRNPNWKFCGVFADEGKSGTSTKYRNEFNQMIQLAKTGNLDMIITKSISRFARNTVDCLSVIKELKLHNVEVFFEKENISSYDTKIDFVISVLAGMAQEESRSISENVKWRQRTNFKNGKVPMVTSTFLGYIRNEKDEITIVSKEAKVVKKIYDMYTTGSSLDKIVEHLNDKGFKTKATNKKYYRSAVRNILTNERYTGNAILQKSRRAYIGDRNGIKNQSSLPKYYVENSHPAIVTLEQFTQVQQIMHERTLKNNQKQIPINKNSNLYSQFIECANCGNYFFSRVNNPGKVYERHMLICYSNKNKKTCSAESLFEEHFTNTLISQINYIIANKKDFLAKLRSQIETSPNILKRKERIKKITYALDEVKTNKSSIYKSKVTKLTIERARLENDLLITYNIDVVINRYKILLKGFNTPIKTIEEFPFKQLIKKFLVYNRNYLQLIIDPFESDSSTSVIYNKSNYEYTIRKTTNQTSSELVFIY